jgi:hypothetical protein
VYSSNTYDSTTKIFYRPIDAAIRWCNLLAHEAAILKVTSYSPSTLASVFPHWPCLHANTEKILDAIINHELPYGVLGKTVEPGTPIDCKLVTIRHTDLRSWMLHYYPEQRPTFLFGPSKEDNKTMSIGTYLTLRADRDALEAELKNAKNTIESLITELTNLKLEEENLRKLTDINGPINDQNKGTLLKIIGALIETILSSSQSGRRHSIFDSQAAIVDSITAHYNGVPGLSKRTLDANFAAAKRSLPKS